MLAAGLVKPLPYLAHNIAELNTALRQFLHARHIGKIVVTVPGTLPEPPAQEFPGAWAITGGLGALGLITAEWLAGQGAQHLHLLGRSGRLAAEHSTSGDSLPETNMAVKRQLVPWHGHVSSLRYDK